MICVSVVCVVCVVCAVWCVCCLCVALGTDKVQEKLHGLSVPGRVRSAPSRQMSVRNVHVSDEDEGVACPKGVSRRLF